MTRHKSLASAMSALLAYRNRPEGDPVPVKTNWSLTPANDNEPEVVADMRTERRIQILPTVEEIMRQVASGDIERGEPTEMTITKDGETKTVQVPGPILRMGRLRFSNGSQITRGHKIGPDGGAVGAEIRMPVGAMFGGGERDARTLGGDENPQEISASNRFFEEMFGVVSKKRVTGRKNIPRAGGTPHADRVQMLADAYANTPDLPSVTKCPPGLPAAGAKIADSFLGMQKAGKGDTGSTSWEGIATALVDREIWAQAMDELSDRDKQTLDAVVHGRAKNYADLGVGLGMQHEYARRKGGKRAIEAANDNLAGILQKVTA